MTITVHRIDGAHGTFNNESITSASWTSTSGSVIVMVGHEFNSNVAPAGTDVTDSKGNTYTLAANAFTTHATSTAGIAIYYNIGGTRGTTHTVTYNGPGSAVTCNFSLVEFSSNNGAMSFESTTDANASDGTSPMEVTLAAAISGSQIAVGGVSVDCGDNVAMTQPSGYTNIFDEPDGTNWLVCNACYKIGETGTPTLSWTRGGTISAAREAVVTFSEPGGGPVFIAPEPLLVPQHIKRGYW